MICVMIVTIVINSYYLGGARRPLEAHSGAVEKWWNMWKMRLPSWFGRES